MMNPPALEALYDLIKQKPSRLKFSWKFCEILGEIDEAYSLVLLETEDIII